MTQPCIITVAITGSVPRKKDNPAVPISTAEQVESTHAAFEAGASLVHVHVRDENENSSSDPDRFAAVQEGIKQHCPGIIIQFSTGGRGRAADQRGSMLYLKPDMASLATGSVNFPGMIYENHPELIEDLATRMLEHRIKPEIEVFDLAMLYSAVRLADKGLLQSPLHVQFVMGVPNALPVRREILDFELAQLKTLLPTATWTVAGVGRGQLDANHWALELGGHCRTGLEDNLRFDGSRLASSNAELVARVTELCVDYGRHPASVTEARQILGL
ncbi:MAG: 3-keto-5-aminohexanoate cleavage protein [Arenicellales bacterium]|nr:3-keto-5-aminohexanoate cleavage protein [Arenicellales bacterium]MDP6949122.1 3-keto-5-aminohexanoate cleavage protein [Arenicellales bacterium]